MLITLAPVVNLLFGTDKTT